MMMIPTPSFFPQQRLQDRSQEQQQQDSASEIFKIGRIQRQKVRIHRKKLFESAVKVMEQFSSSKAVLEIEYFDEVGTGLVRLLRSLFFLCFFE